MLRLHRSNVDSTEKADIVVLGMPDESRSHAKRKSTSRAPDVLRIASNESEYFERNGKVIPTCPMRGTFERKMVFDAGNVDDRQDLYGTIFHLASKSKLPIIIGGDHSLTTEALKATSTAAQAKLSLLYFDAHPDFVSSWRNYYGSVLTDSADCIDFGASMLIGTRAAEPEELANAERAGLKILNPLDIAEIGVNKVSEMIGIRTAGARIYISVDMCAVPARVAGVRRIVAISPPRKDGTVDPLTLVAADVCGVEEFYKVGGAHGIAALVYGTESIRPVNKVVGPGGRIVAAAKLVASGRVGTDMVAGPTELLIYADATADPGLVAADLISQAEHGTDTVCGVVTTSDELASAVPIQVERVVDSIERSEIVKSSLRQNGFIAVCKKETDCIEFVNEFAPEHLEIMSRKPEAVARKVNSAGLILVGSGTPSSASDYCLGSNHVLPTMGFGKSRASLSVIDFVKVVNKVKVTKTGLKKVEASIREIAAAEGLPNHYEAVRARMSR